MHIRLCAITRIAPPAQDLITQSALTYCPALSLAIHRQEVSLVQRDIARWLHRSEELQLRPCCHNCTIETRICVAEGRQRDGGKCAVCQGEVGEGAVTGACEAEEKSGLVEGIL